MWREVLEWLVVDPQGSYLDCTLGGGGHSAAILSRLDGSGQGQGTVIALDQDPDALAFATRRLATAVEHGAFRAVRANFRSARAVLEAERCVPPGGFHGMLLDLGVSSHQLDQASRVRACLRLCGCACCIHWISLSIQHCWIITRMCIHTTTTTTTTKTKRASASAGTGRWTCACKGARAAAPPPPPPPPPPACQRQRGA